MSETITYFGTLTVVNCATCQMPFGIPVGFKTDRVNDHRSFYCPAGHSNVYAGKSEAEKLRERLILEERRAVARLADNDRLRAEVEHEKARTRGYKGALVKAKKRAAEGVCPVAGCKRHFVDVERHIANKHPGYAPEPSS